MMTQQLAQMRLQAMLEQLGQNGQSEYDQQQAEAARQQEAQQQAQDAAQAKVEQQQSLSRALVAAQQPLESTGGPTPDQFMPGGEYDMLAPTGNPYPSFVNPSTAQPTTTAAPTVASIAGPNGWVSGAPGANQNGLVRTFDPTTQTVINAPPGWRPAAWGGPVTPPAATPTATTLPGSSILPPTTTVNAPTPVTSSGITPTGNPYPNVNPGATTQPLVPTASLNTPNGTITGGDDPYGLKALLDQRNKAATPLQNGSTGAWNPAQRYGGGQGAVDNQASFMGNNGLGSVIKGSFM